MDGGNVSGKQMSAHLSKGGHDLDLHENCDSGQVALVGSRHWAVTALSFRWCVEEHSKRKM